MANKVQIINKALSLLGMKRITSVDDDLPQAIAANATWEISLESVLSSGLFGFSIQRVALALTSDTLAFTENDKSLVYQKPTDCLRAVDFYPSIARVSVEGDKFISDTANLCVRYVYRNDDTSQYFPAFVEAFAFKLAADMSYALSNGSTKGADLLTAYENIYLPRAKSADNSQGDAIEQDADDILLAKYGVLP